MATEVEEMPLLLPSMAEWEKLLRPDDLSGPFVVIIYDDDWHTFDAVIHQVCKATGCSLDKAQQIANRVHYEGRSIAYAGSKEKCDQVAGILREIRLNVETTRAV